MPAPPDTRDAITAALKLCGPMTVPELVQHLGWPRNRVNSCLSASRSRYPGKLFRIIRYHKQVGVQGRETPVYSASAGPDAPRPDFGAAHRLERAQRYYRDNRARYAAVRRRQTGKTQASPWSGLVPIQSRQPHHP